MPRIAVKPALTAKNIRSQIFGSFFVYPKQVGLARLVLSY